MKKNKKIIGFASFSGVMMLVFLSLTGCESVHSTSRTTPYEHVGFLHEVRYVPETNPSLSKTYLFFNDGVSLIITDNSTSAYALCKPFEMKNVSVDYSITELFWVGKWFGQTENNSRYSVTTINSIIEG